MNFVVIEVCLLVILATCIRVQTLECSSNKRCVCHKINGDLWAMCENLTLASAPTFSNDVIGVILANNILNNFPTNLPLNVTYLDLSRNLMRIVNQQSIEKYRYLRNLSISRNSLQIIELGSFQNSPNLLHLDISGNQELTLEVLANISRDLRNSTAIRVLNFENLQCTYGVSFIVKRYHLIGLKQTHLEELNLASNRINSLEAGVLSELPKSLKHLSLANNRLSFEIYLVEFGDLPNIMSINASFQSSFHQLNVDDILMDCNDIRKVSVSSSKNQVLGQRKKMPLQRPKNITFFLPSTLQTVYFHDNMYKMTLQDFSFKFFGKPTLSKLYLQNNIIYELNGPITGMKSVIYADFSNNFCSYISPRFFEDFRNLSHLDLSYNALGENLENDVDGKIFQNLRMLTSLNLTRNRILRLPAKIFQNLVQLKQLNLSYNSLGEFTMPINHMVHLSNIDLSDNQISSINMETRKMLHAISHERHISLNLRGNKLRCDCGNVEFVKWVLNSKNIVFLHFDDYLCTLTNFTKIRFSDNRLLELLDKQCSSYTLIIVIITSLIFVILTITISRIVYRYRWKLRYMYYVAREKYKDNQKRQETLDLFHFDAFVSYAEKDRTFVIDLVKRLEEEFNLKLCIHHRDFIPGTGIADNITNAIHNSRKTVCVITSHFLHSYWCMFELNMARMEAIYSRNGENVLLLVALEKDVMKSIPFTFMDLIDSKSYIDFPEEGGKDEETGFRSKLGDALKSRDNKF
ncbi:toll-like receptor 4 [Saccostrea cucullata]|uniref:toll-like receptor 4 n=1 Tax=Saccostrea cuccullata TaxID=36930 RepID=UPI002ED15EF1